MPMPADVLLPDGGLEAAGGVRRLSKEQELVLCCARTALDAPCRARIERLAGQEVGWERICRLAERNGVLPLVLRSLKAAAPEQIPPGVLAEMERYAHSVARKNLLLAQELVRLLDRLGALGIPAIPLKGVVLAEAAYGRLVLRQASDLDLLIRSEDLPRTERLLLRDCYAPQKPLSTLQRKAYVFFNRQLPYARYDTDPPLLVELHTGLTSRNRPLATSFGALLERARPVTLLGRTVPHLAAPDLLPFLCMHAGAKHDWSVLKWVCDVAETVQADPPTDWPAVLEHARAQRAERSLLVGLLLTQTCLGTTLPAGVVRRFRSDAGVVPVAQRALAALMGRPAQKEPLQQVLWRKLSLCDTPSAKARYLTYHTLGLAARRVLRI